VAQLFSLGHMTLTKTMKLKYLAIMLCLSVLPCVAQAQTNSSARFTDYPILDKDVHLMVRVINDVSADDASEFPVYILLLPHNPVIFKTFDSKDMERVIRDCLAPGSVLYFNGTPGIVRPTDAQVLSLKDFCKSVGITLVL